MSAICMYIIERWCERWTRGICEYLLLRGISGVYVYGIEDRIALGTLTFTEAQRADFESLKERLSLALGLLRYNADPEETLVEYMDSEESHVELLSLMRGIIDVLEARRRRNAGTDQQS